MSRRVVYYGSVPKLVLDLYPASYAYSFRKLRTDYAGQCIRVRRSTDNAEQDIGFSGNYIDESALTSFIGANSGYVTTWYDQSGNGVNKINTSASLQPVIVNGGTVSKYNGFVGMQSTSTLGHRGLQNTITSGGSSSMAFNVFKIDNASECLPATNIGTTRFYAIMQNNASSPTQSSGTPTYYKNGTALTSPTRADLYNAFTNLFSVLTTYQVDLSAWAISSSLYPSYRGITGYNMEEIVYYTSSTSRSDIETNQKNYYGIS